MKLKKRKQNPWLNSKANPGPKRHKTCLIVTNIQSWAWQSVVVYPTFNDLRSWNMFLPLPCVKWVISWKFLEPWYFTIPNESQIGTRRVGKRGVSESVMFLTPVTRRVMASHSLCTCAFLSLQNFIVKKVWRTWPTVQLYISSDFSLSVHCPSVIRVVSRGSQSPFPFSSTKVF